MNRTSSLIAALALGAAGIAFAQGNPPTTASPNPATGAGQQSPAGGPMGATGTMPQSGTSGATAPMPKSSQASSSSDQQFRHFGQQQLDHVERTAHAPGPRRSQLMAPGTWASAPARR
jgi:hypothetical protein